MKVALGAAACCPYFFVYLRWMQSVRDRTEHIALYFTVAKRPIINANIVNHALEVFAPYAIATDSESTRGGLDRASLGATRG